MPTTALDQHSGEWTVDDVLAADFPEHLRVECVDGALLVSPRPDLWHQHHSIELMVALRSAVPPGCLVLAEVDLRAGGNLRIPDVVVSRPGLDLARRTVDATDLLLVVEIESPSSRRTDRLLKPTEYAAAGIGAYWRVERDPVALATHELVGGAYVERHRLTEPGRVDVPFVVEVNLWSTST